MIVEIVTAVMLVIAAYYDFRTMRIPDRVQIVAALVVWGAIAIFDPYSWKTRGTVMLLLMLLVFVGVLLNQSGAGDLKMMVWFGAGFAISAIEIFVFGVMVSSIWGIGKWVAREENRWVPFAPCLLLGLIVQFM